jgi:thiamine biosynthesis lipoprotein
MVQVRIQLVFLLVGLASCKEQPNTVLKGKTMGTYYEIEYNSRQNYQLEIDSLLAGFIASASTYDSTSELSRFNRAGFIPFESPHLLKMLILAGTLHKETRGAFEPTLMPLIKAHGFSTSKRQALSRYAIDSLLSYVSFKYIIYDTFQMATSKPGVQLDLSAMGEGYAIDMIADFLEGKNVSDYKVEIGGEMKCKGKNVNGGRWLIGVENPSGTGNKILATVKLEDEAISTSGASRRFYLDENGSKRSHIIDPRTGHSIQNNLLSVTVKDRRAVRADALATALMVMGLDSGKSFVETSEIEALIVYEENGKVLSWHSPGFFNIQDRDVAIR